MARPLDRGIRRSLLHASDFCSLNLSLGSPFATIATPESRAGILWNIREHCSGQVAELGSAVEATNDELPVRTTIEHSRHRIHYLAILIVLQPTSWEFWVIGAIILVVLYLVVRLLHSRKIPLFVTKKKQSHRQESSVPDKESSAFENSEGNVSSELLRIVKLKNDCVEHVTHELQALLSWVVTSLETVLRSEPDHEMTETKPRLEIAIRNARLSLYLANQLSNLAILEAASIKLTARPQNIVHFLQQFIELLSPEVERLQIRLLFACSLENLRAFFDPPKLESILLNLISYSVMATPAGGKILVSLAVTDEESKLPESVEISVRDTGIGMKAESLRQLMDTDDEPSQPSMTSRARVGLAVVDQLTRLHRATIQVSSVPGFGTSFTMRLPVSESSYNEGEIRYEEEEVTPSIPEGYLPESLERKPSTGISEIQKAGTDRGNRSKPLVLVVQADVEAQNVIHESLEEKYTILSAADGRTGLKLAKSTFPDLIICDINLPEMGGIALARQLKQNTRLYEIPVILLSSRNSSETKIESWSVGADEVIARPIIPSELIARADSLILSRKILRDRYAKRTLVQPDAVDIPSADSTFLGRVKEVVSLHLENPAFTVGMLASELNISEAQLKRRMNTLVGEPPVEYIRSFRLEKAAQLLDRKVGNVSEISFAVGFQNLSYFSKCFRERYGMTPSQYASRDKSHYFESNPSGMP